jgi:hypothetical protein
MRWARLDEPLFYMKRNLHRAPSQVSRGSGDAILQLFEKDQKRHFGEKSETWKKDGSVSGGLSASREGQAGRIHS